MTAGPDRRLALGILGCADIARQFTRDVAGSASVRIAAVASRDARKAEEFAAACGIALEKIDSPTGSGFRFAAETFARMVAQRDQADFERAAQMSVDNARTLEAIAQSARSGGTVAVAAAA